MRPSFLAFGLVSLVSIGCGSGAAPSGAGGGSSSTSSAGGGATGTGGAGGGSGGGASTSGTGSTSSAGTGGAGTGGGGIGGGMECGNPPNSGAFVRVNQVGYRTDDSKRAFLMSPVAEDGAMFQVLDATCQPVLSAPIGADLGSWSNGYPHVYPLDLSALKTEGKYTIAVTGAAPAQSPIFAIGAGPKVYSGLLANAHYFYEAQHDGPMVDGAILKRKPSHLDDAKASVYDVPSYTNDQLTKKLAKLGNGTVDVSGGWFDAGDYIKFVQTTSYVEAVMLLAVRDHAAALGPGPADFHGEAKYGLDWLRRMWDDGTQTLLYQVGIGDGSSALNIDGDHDTWRLPEDDDALQVAPGDSAYYVRYRPAFRAAAPGGMLSPNLAGRLAADFGLCSQVYRASDAALADACLLAGEHVFALANPQPAKLMTAAPYDYYPETSWRDDLELGAVELHLALAGAGANLPAGLPHTDPAYYLAQAATWAHAYLTSAEDGTDSLNLYDVSALGHYELVRAIKQAGSPGNLAVTTAALLGDLKSQLQTGSDQAKKDPFGFGIPYAGGDATPHALGLSVTASLYEEVSSDAAFHDFGLRQRDYALGANAWGTSFLVGAGTTFPLCLHHQIANLSGALDGSMPILLGAIVDGPGDPADFAGATLDPGDGHKACPAGGGDVFKAFSGHGARYQDDVAKWPSVEPAIDYSALTVLLFARQ